MGKVIMDDADIINIAQLTAKHGISNVTGEKVENIEKQIVMRMSDRALDWYLKNMVPVVGRPILKDKWAKWRK